MSGHKLERKDLMGLEEYALKRDTFREQIIAYKRARTLHIGPNLTLLFEDWETMRYQVQEMLRAERIFEAAGIQDELEAYNPLIPDGSNWKATMLIEFGEVEERREALGKLIGIEDKVWMRVHGHAQIFPIADEDLERETAEKTSAVHFLRFELTSSMVKALKEGELLDAGVDHPEYSHSVKPVPAELQKSLISDLS
jgi:hypothetical protein